MGNFFRKLIQNFRLWINIRFFPYPSVETLSLCQRHIFKYIPLTTPLTKIVFDVYTIDYICLMRDGCASISLGDFHRISSYILCYSLPIVIFDRVFVIGSNSRFLHENSQTRRVSSKKKTVHYASLLPSISCGGYFSRKYVNWSIHKQTKMIGPLS